MKCIFSNKDSANKADKSPKEGHNTVSTSGKSLRHAVFIAAAFLLFLSLPNMSYAQPEFGVSGPDSNWWNATWNYQEGYVEISLAYYHYVQDTSNPLNAKSDVGYMEKNKVVFAYLFHGSTALPTQFYLADLHGEADIYDDRRMQITNFHSNNSNIYVPIDNGVGIEWVPISQYTGSVVPTPKIISVKFNTYQNEIWRLGVFRWYIPDSLYGKPISIYFENGLIISPTWHYNSLSSPPAMPLLTSDLILTDIKSPVNVSFNRVESSGCKNRLSWGYSANGEHPTHYKVEDMTADDTTELGSGAYTSTGNSFSWDVTENYLQKKHVYAVSSYVPSGHARTLLTTAVPIFIQPKNFAMAYSHDDRKVTLTWQCPKLLEDGYTPGTDYLTNPFTIQRSTSPTFATIDATYTVAYDTSKLDYTFVDETFLTRTTDATWYYRVARVDNGGWGYCFAKTASEHISNGYVKITHLNPIEYDSTRNTAIITWTRGGRVWFNNSTFTIKRVDRTNGTETTILSTSDSSKIGACKYEDNKISICSWYQYELEIQTNNSIYPNEAALLSTMILPSRIGHLVTFNADKGYHTDKIMLDWESMGDFTGFEIERKEYYADESTYQLVDYVEARSSRYNYTYEDLYAYPSIVYLYRITGLKACADTMLKSAPLFDAGFRFPEGVASGHIHYGNGTAVPGVRIMATPLDAGEAGTNKSLLLGGDNNSYILLPNAANVLTSRDSFAFQAYIARSEKRGDT
jgi:hypothetical protein